MKNNGDTIRFLKEKDYIMVNNNLGGGSFGKTVVIQDPFINELFVAKKYEPDFDDEALKIKFYKNFLEEIKIMHKLNHMNIVRIYNYYAYETLYTGYILMEYIDGSSIESWFEDCSMGLTTSSSNEIFIQLINAFDYLEKQGVIHRDIREGNILITKNDIVKVIDFGIGKLVTPESTAKDSLYSKINRENSDTLPMEYYNGIYTSQTDMFYLAELINRLLTQYPCSEFKYRNIINIMMEKDPQNRYNSFGDVKTAIEQMSFEALSITREEKQIYCSFAESLNKAIANYTNEKSFNTDYNIIIDKLDEIISNNIFEENICGVSDLIGAFVNGGYSYYDVQIQVSAVLNFMNLLKKSADSKCKLIVANLIHKISQKPVIPDDEYPF